MRKLVTALLVASSIYGATEASADQYPRHRHNHYNNGGGNNWVAPLLGGMIIGGLLVQGNNNYYYQEQPRYYYPQPPQPRYCRSEYAGEYWNGWQWVPSYQRVCY